MISVFSMILTVILSEVTSEMLQINRILPEQKPPTYIIESSQKIDFTVTTNDINCLINNFPGTQFSIVGIYGADHGFNIAATTESSKTFYLEIYQCSDKCALFSNITVPFDASSNTVYRIEFLPYQFVVSHAQGPVTAKTFEASIYPDYIQGKYRSLNFFQINGASDCGYNLTYSGKYVGLPEAISGK